MLDIDPGRSRAVLMGVSCFPSDGEHLPPLKGVLNNLDDLQRDLGAPDLVGLAPHAITVVKEATAAEMLSALAKLAEEADDTLIVYYAGHGLVGGTSLYLAGRDSSERFIEYNGIAFDKMRQAIIESPARKKVLVLDCCYSGRAAELMGGSTQQLLQASINDVEGTYVLASSGATTPSLAPRGERHTAFTGELIDLLERGIAGRGPTLKLGEIYDELQRRCRSRNLPKPQPSAKGTAAAMDFAYNRAPAKDATVSHGETPGQDRATADEDAAWREQLVAMLEQQTRQISELERRIADRDRQEYSRLGRSTHAQRLEEDAADFRSRQSHGVTGVGDYQRLMETQRQRIEELNAALQRLQLGKHATAAGQAVWAAACHSFEKNVFVRVAKWAAGGGARAAVAAARDGFFVFQTGSAALAAMPTVSPAVGGSVSRDLADVAADRPVAAAGKLRVALWVVVAQFLYLAVAGAAVSQVNYSDQNSFMLAYSLAGSAIWMTAWRRLRRKHSRIVALMFLPLYLGLPGLLLAAAFLSFA